MDLTIEGKVYLNGKFERCCIGIEKGKIAVIKKILKCDEHLDFGNKLILPGGIDIHVHFRDPGFTHKEDFTTGSKSAAFGGITCVFDMPNTKPHTTDTKELINKKKTAENKSYVDFGIYAAITDSNIEKIREISKHCNGFKIYLERTTSSLEISEQNLHIALKKAESTDGPVLIHAESGICLKEHSITRENLQDHLRSRPAECEEIALKKIISSSKKVKTKIHICHLSSCEGFKILKERTQNLSIGVTPHHLLFDVNRIESNETWYKVNPPIRTSFDKEYLWSEIENGGVDILESDHAPHTLEEKSQRFEDAPPGIPGVETMFPLFLASVKREELSFNRLVSLLCEKPAELMNIPKGKIEVGRDADFLVVDFRNVCKIKSEMLHSKCGWTPFEGWRAIFPEHVFSRGERLIEDHEMLGRQGFGKFVGESS